MIYWGTLNSATKNIYYSRCVFGNNCKVPLYSYATIKKTKQYSNRSTRALFSSNATVYTVTVNQCRYSSTLIHGSARACVCCRCSGITCLQLLRPNIYIRQIVGTLPFHSANFMTDNHSIKTFQNNESTCN